MNPKVALPMMSPKSESFVTPKPRFHPHMAIESATWERIIDRMRRMRKVDHERDFDSEPEPFI